MLRGRRQVIEFAGLLLILGLLFLPALDSRDFWQTDEIRYAEVARQMQEYDHLLVPHHNGFVYPEKPPLYFWAVIALEPLLGDYKMSGRLVAGLGIGAAAFALLALGRLLFADRRLGILAALLFATSVTPLSRGQIGLIDSLLVGFCTWSLFALLASAAAVSGGRRVAWGITAGLLLAAGCLCKGPVALLVPVLGALVCGFARSGVKGVNWTSLLLGLGLALAGSLLWLFLATREAGDWLWDYMLFDQIRDRSGEGSQHDEPWHFYLSRVLPIGLLPWTLLLPGCGMVLWRRRSSDRGRVAFSWLLLAMLIILLFSLISGKRVGYLLPVFPILALAMAYALVREAGQKEFLDMRLAGRWPMHALVSLPFLLAAAFFLLPMSLPWVMPLLVDPAGQSPSEIVQVLAALPWPAAILAAALLTVCGLLARRGLRAGGSLQVIWALSICIAGGSALAHLYLVPVADRFRSPRAFYERVADLHVDGEQLVLLGNISYRRINWYSQREHYPVLEPEHLDQYAGAPGRLWVLADRRVWLHVPEVLRRRFESMDTGEQKHHRFVLYRELE